MRAWRIHHRQGTLICLALASMFHGCDKVDRMAWEACDALLFFTSGRWSWRASWRAPSGTNNWLFFSDSDDEL